MASTPAIIPVSAADEEVDITRQQHQHRDTSDDGAQRTPSRSRKGKERAENLESSEDLTQEREGSLWSGSEQSLNGGTRTASYPPLNDEQEETRRIQENLKRMEEAELQRRKAARQSSLLAGNGDGGGGGSQSSIVENVSRRASILWQNRVSGHHSGSSGSSRRNGSMAGSGLGHHQKLPSTDNLPLTDIATAADSPTVSPTRSETNSSIDTVSTITAPQQYQRRGTESNAKRLQELVDDPFNPPEEHETQQLEMSSPFSDPPEPSTPGAYQTSALAGASSRLGGLSSDCPDVDTTITRQPPPPKPLGLPRPKTPPPPLERGEEDEGEMNVGKKTRWWHEWLCGCGEGGDNQAGKTNPFE